MLVAFLSRLRPGSKLRFRQQEVAAQSPPLMGNRRSGDTASQPPGELLLL